MAHEIDKMAFVGETPWHGLGNKLPEGQDIETWRIAAGLDWEVETSPLYFGTKDRVALDSYPNRSVLVRSDTKAPLSIMSDKYKVVQPAEVLEFYKDLAEQNDLELETAGSLRGGAKVWALAKTGFVSRIKGQDEMRDYVLLATSYDGSMSTVATRTAIRVVCNNTLEFAVDDAQSSIKIPHSQAFIANDVKNQLGLTEEVWGSFIEQATELSNRKVSTVEGVQYFINLFFADDVDVGAKHVQKRAHNMLSLCTTGAGQHTTSAKGTAWGLLNAVTLFTDHVRGTDTHRLDSAWFGNGAALKRKAFDMALKLVA